ncbi:MAG: histidine kinase [Bacteroidales bacterium]|nr:histidine kinase [Bacteroidales bacterium]
MKKQENKITKHVLNVSIIIAISVAITFMFGSSTWQWQEILLNIAYGALIGLSIAIGSSFISKRMLKDGNWLDKPIKRFIAVIVAVSIYIIVDVILVNIVWFNITQDLSIADLLHSNFFIWIVLTELMIGMIIYLIIVSARFAKSLNEFYVEAEEQKRELNHYKYATLKNQVNPHFLFNSLNVLSALIYKDVEKADDFIGKLSNIYRYVLDVQDEEVVSVEQEVAFAKDFLFLQAIRFGDNLKYDINVSTDKMIIPMALQILIENALKHNVISEEHQLEIKISSDKQYVIVSNNVMLKQSSEASHELGLANIKGRYKFLTDMEVKITESTNRFEVCLPLLNLK